MPAGQREHPMVEAPQQGCQGAALGHARFPAEGAGGLARRGRPDHLVAGGGVRLGHAADAGGLPRTGHAQDQGHLPPVAADSTDRVRLPGGERPAQADLGPEDGGLHQFPGDGGGALRGGSPGDDLGDRRLHRQGGGGGVGLFPGAPHSEEGNGVGRGQDPAHHPGQLLHRLAEQGRGGRHDDVGGGEDLLHGQAALRAEGPAGSALGRTAGRAAPRPGRPAQPRRPGRAPTSRRRPAPGASGASGYRPGCGA